MRRMLAVPILGALSLGVACGGGASEGNAPATSGATAATVATPAARAADAPAAGSTTGEVVVLAEGRFALPAAGAFEDPGFHHVVSATHELPAAIDIPAGARLVVELRDASRPGQTCSRQHPLSGCATVDWSDFEGRAGVPEGGVFDHRLVLATSEGERPVFLSESGALADAPDPLSPG